VLLILKLVLVPTLVAAVTLAARRWGLRVGGVLTALPMVAGPTLGFYAIEQGHAFAASASRATMLGIAASGAFCVAYAWSARRVSWAPSVLAGWGAFACTALAMYGLPDLRGGGELALAVGALLISSRLLPTAPAGEMSITRQRWDLPMRMLVAAGVVVLFTALAALLGARLSGVLTALPVVTMIIAVFTHVQSGAGAIAAYFRGLLRGLHSFALFCAVFSAALGALEWGLLPATAAALAAQLSLQSLVLWRMSGR
jgi:hypothetical protein